MAESVVIRGKTYDLKETLGPWLERKRQAEREKDKFQTQVKVNRKFAAGKQHLDVNHRDGRVIDVRSRNGIKLVTSDILTQYLLTVRGRLTGYDYKSTFLTTQENELAYGIADQLNMSFSWGWDHEWQGDQKINQLFNYLLIDGTCGLQVRYDRRFGEVVGEVPFVDGVPIIDEDEQIKYVSSLAEKGETADFDILREGRVTWTIVPWENLFWPPGIEDPNDFPWDLIRRVIPVKDLKDRYPKLAKDINEENIESTAVLTAGLGMGDHKPENLPGRCFVYTGFLRPCSDYPQGQVVIFTAGDAGEHILDVRNTLNYPDHPRGASTGLHYFRWQTIPGRFPGRAFIEGGIGPQIIRNKRLTQIDAIIDRNLPKVYAEENSIPMPKTGEPNEVIPVRPGSPLPKTETGVPPGAWMLDDVKLQDENAERALGIAPVTRGVPPQGISAYSALALLSENDALKLDPIANDIRLILNEVSWDTMEAMRNWPSNKQIMIAGPESQLQSFEFNANIIPMRYLVRPPRGGALPRTQAAELQKIDDIWAASAGTLPLTWYKDSKDQGKAQDLPPSLSDQHAHKAELENVIIQITQIPPPVAEYDDHVRHVEIHRTAQVQAQALADLGDPQAQAQVEAFEAHCQQHLDQAQVNQQSTGAAPPPPPGAAPSGGSPTAGGGAQPVSGGLNNALGGVS